MNGERRARRLFLQALDLPTAERDAWLHEACGDDAALALEVRELLAADAGSSSFLTGTAREVVDGAAVLAPGESLHGYRVVEELGRGGMGVVYLAQRENSGGDARVALKVLRAGLAPELRQRFAAEAEILETLDHPFIARFLDSGITPQGLPYLVMEHVDGAPITAYCDRHRLTVEDRLLIFIRVCDAVAYAHRHLVAHRDLKPSNILVDPGGKPRLLDFGIAKVVTPDLPTTGSYTDSSRMLTPLYASPEQLRGERPTLASDVYSLGVVLFELLTGTLPFARGEALDFAALWREPPRPSDAAAETATANGRRPEDSITATARAALRRTTPEGLRRALRGDLDIILQRALRPEPDQRYPSVEQLAEDVHRHLRELPIRARPPRLGYRAGKLVRRQPLVVGLAAALAAAVISFAGYAGMQSRRFAAERDSALEARARAEAVTDALIESFDVTGLPRAEGGLVAARAILDEGDRRAGELSAFPDLQASLRHALGVAYDRLGIYPESLRLFDQALATRQRRFGTEASPALATLFASTSPLRSLQKLDEAEHRGRSVLEARRRQLGDSAPLTGEAAAGLADTLWHAARYEAARVLAGQALRAHRAPPRGDDQSLATDLDVMSRIEAALGRYAPAEKASREALDIARHRHGREHMVVALALRNLARPVQQQGRLVEAGQLLQESLEMEQRLVGPDHPEVAGCRQDLGENLMLQGQYPQALAQFETALAILRRAFGESHPQVADALVTVSLLALQQGDTARAEPPLREALAIYRRFPANQEKMGVAISNLAFIVLQQGRMQESEDLYREGLGILRAAHGPTHPLVGLGLNNLAFAVWERGDRAEAERLFQQALEVYKAIPSPALPDSARVLNNLALLRRMSGDLVSAEKLAREGLAARREALGEMHPFTGDSYTQLAAVLAVVGRVDEAKQEAERALAAYRESLPESHWRVGMAHLVHGLARASMGDYDGQAEAERGYRGVRDAWPPGAVRQVDAADLLALTRRRFARRPQ